MHNPQVILELQDVAAGRSEGVDVPGSLWDVGLSNESVRTSEFETFDSASRVSLAGNRVESVSSRMGDLEASNIAPLVPEVDRVERSSEMNLVVIENQDSDQVLDLQATNSQIMNSESVGASSHLAVDTRFTQNQSINQKGIETSQMFCSNFEVSDMRQNEDCFLLFQFYYPIPT